MSNHASYYTRLNQVNIDRLKELKQACGKTMSGIVTEMFDNLGAMINRNEEFNRKHQYEEFPRMPKVVYPVAILVPEGDKEVRLPFPDELKKHYKRLSPYSRRQELRLWLDESTINRIDEACARLTHETRSIIEANSIIEDFIDCLYYDVILKPQLEAEKQRKEAEETLAMVSDESYWKAPKKK